MVDNLSLLCWYPLILTRFVDTCQNLTSDSLRAFFPVTLFSKMSLSDELSLGFANLNIKIDDRILSRCVQICQKYQIDVEDFLDQWMAYTASHLNGAPPSLDALNRLERKEFAQGKAQTSMNTSRNISTMDIDIETPSILEETPFETVQTQSETVDSTQISTQYSQRTDARAMQCEFGLKTLFESLIQTINISILNEDIVNNNKYMYEKLMLRQQSLNSMAMNVVNSILDHYKLELTKEKLKEYAGDMTICGRIYSESGKLNAQSVLLEGTLDFYRGQSLNLDVDKMEKIALFNGQIVVIKGNNVKNRFAAKEIYSGAPMPLPELPTNPEKLQIVVASGPFTLANNLLYEPLEDLIVYVQQFRPNILLLMGPFMDSANGALETLNETYDSYFETMMADLMRRLEQIQVQVVLIPSERDVHNHPIFPSPPYRLRRSHKNLILAPNPCLLDLNGFVLGVSTTDILFHTSKSEYFKDLLRKDGMDRMSRLAKHVLDQRTFYPLHPPDLDVRLDYQMLERGGMLEKTPHMLILPSNLRHFVKKIDECVVVNPERLTKGQVGGTFARIEVRPGESEPVCDRITCQVLRV